MFGYLFEILLFGQLTGNFGFLYSAVFNPKECNRFTAYSKHTVLLKIIASNANLLFNEDLILNFDIYESRWPWEF